MSILRPSGTRTVARAITDRQVTVVYQPIVDLLNGSILAYEALARCGAKGLENPMDLFHAAAEQKLCGKLGRILRELAVIECPGHALFLNVHPHELSERWLVQPDDPIYSHEPGVYLEITEAVPLSHHALVKGTLNELRSKGVGVVVDDLGAGYSNLRYIADLHPEVVKLDRGLIERLDTDPRRMKLVTGIVRLCNDLGARVVAEGVETTGELSAVMDAGVHFVQGYLLARPACPPPLPVAQSGIPVSQPRRTTGRPLQPLPAPPPVSRREAIPRASSPPKKSRKTTASFRNRRG